MRRARPRPLCVLPSRALAVLLLATSVVPLPERRWWCPLPGQRHSASAVGPATGTSWTVSFGARDLRDKGQYWIDLGDEGGLFGGDACLGGAVADFFGELGGRGFGLDDGGGSFVSVSREVSTSELWVIQGPKYALRHDVSCAKYFVKRKGLKCMWTVLGTDRNLYTRHRSVCHGVCHGAPRLE